MEQKRRTDMGGTVSILEQDIGIVRPKKVLDSRREGRKSVWRPSYDKRPKERQLGVAEFFRLCLSYKDFPQGGRFWERG